MTDFEKGAEARFWAKVEKRGPDECWPWLGADDGRGRGMMWVHGGNVKAPRLAWEIANGRSLAPGMKACHSCDNPNCVNPAHIWEGTQSQNIRDGVAKGRVEYPICRKNSEKTHCAQGHPYSEENTRVITYPNGRFVQRRCRACNREHHRKMRAARRALAPDARPEERK